MASFLLVHGVTWHTEAIIKGSRERLFLVSPFVRLSDALLQCIKEAGQRVPTSIVFREFDLPALLVQELRQVKKLTLLQNPAVHSKCYLNEQTMVVTSMNLSAFEGSHDFEMGVLIDKELDANLYQSAFDEVIRIVDASRVVHL
jgi:phosphatidylserine/phosphatidylglycerophosphate/cardiolipin synthase-like enzyme